MAGNVSLGAALVFDQRQCSLGEGPVWDSESGRFYWVDILEGKVLWRDLAGANEGEYSLPAHIGAVLPGENGVWWAFLTDGVFSMDSNGKNLKEVARFPHQLGPEQGVARMRANDAAVSPRGDVLCGTMPYAPDRHPGTACLYRFDGATLEPIITGVTISNGLGWTSDGSQVFYVDTPTGRVDCFDVGPQGELLHRRPFCSLDSEPGFPDGLAVDGAGSVWVALWDGHRIQRLSPDGELDGYIEVPARNVTSCAFGGPNLTTLVITTASLDDDSPAAGLTYFFELEVPGAPTYRVAS